MPIRIPHALRSVRRTVLGVALTLAGLGMVVVPGSPAGATPLPQGLTTTEAPLPGNAGTNPDVYTASSTCAAPGICVTVGAYDDSSARDHGLIEMQSGSTFTGIEAPVPANGGSGSDQNVQLGSENCGFVAPCNAVSCPTTTSCVAVGQYETTGGFTYGVIDTLSGGTWTAQTAPEPSNAGTEALSHQFGWLTSVKCTSTTSCVAVGFYETSTATDQADVDVLSGTTWTSLSVPEPADGEGAFSELLNIDCASTTSCVAIGEYEDTGNRDNGLLVSVNGVTLNSQSTPLPANSGTDALHNLEVEMQTVSCATNTSCVAVGNYENLSGSVVPLIDTLSGGVWSAILAPEPSDAATGSSAGGTVSSVSCPIATWCVAVGSFTDASSKDLGLIDTLSGGTWTPSQAPEPADEATGASQSADLYRVACPTVAWCITAGQYAGLSPAISMHDVFAAGSWTAFATPEPANAKAGATADGLAKLVSCSAPAACLISGSYLDSSGNHQAYLDTLTGVQGYWLTASDGGIFTFGNAQFFGSTGALTLNKPIVGMAATPDGQGYWLVATDGGVFSFGDAAFHGSTGALTLNKPIVGMAATPDGKGYWLVASDGGIFSFGDAAFHGSTGAFTLNKPIVGMASTPSGQGYWLVATDGGIFSFGDATFFGSTGAIHLNKPIVGMGATPNGDGYWLVASDGGIFTFGAGTFYGSTGAIMLNKPIVGMAASPSGHGYWLVATDGGIFSFGDASFYGSTGAITLNKPIVGMAT